MAKYRSPAAREKRSHRRRPHAIWGGRALAVGVWAVAFLAGGSLTSATAQPQPQPQPHELRAQRAASPIAVEATELSVHETAHCHLVSHHREVLFEEGYGSGTLSGKLVIHLSLAYTQGSVAFTAYPPGGTITGSGEGSSYAKGNTAYFNGTASITRGTGKYAHASASDVKIRGTLQRKTFVFVVEVNAKLRY